MGSLSIFFLGTIIGVIWTNIIWRFFIVGKLRVDTSDPDDQPYMFLELSKNITSVIKKKYIVLRVDTNNFLPPK